VSAQENEALVRRYFEEVWAKGNVAAVDEFMAPNCVEHRCSASHDFVHSSPSTLRRAR
jgi:hypothetical protein